MKKIGIAGWKTGDNSFGVSTSYLEFISTFGVPYIITPMDSSNPPDLDLLVLPGGADVNPLTYGQVPSFQTGPPNLMLEHFDKNILPFYLDNNTPIFGICRGAQKLWSLFGGKLIQHNPYHKQSGNNKKEECHNLYFLSDYRWMDQYVDKVTSRHHQTMDSQDAPDQLEIIAFSNEKNGNFDFIDSSIVEIFKIKDKRIFGVQYHPEDNTTEKLSSLIIDDLLNKKGE